jgi:hypothetical protein
MHNVIYPKQQIEKKHETACAGLPLVQIGMNSAKLLRVAAGL